MGAFDQSNIINGRIFMGVQALIFKLFGQSVFTLRLPALLCGFGVLILTGLLAWELFASRRAAFLSAAILALSHLFLLTSHLGRADMMITLFVLLSVYLFFKAKSRGSNALFFFSGLTAAWAVDVHPPGNIAVFVLSALFLHQLFKREVHRKQALWAAAGGILGILWWGFWHVFIHPEVFKEQWTVIKERGGDGTLLPPLNLELRRWTAFFWDGLYRRNMYLLFLFCLSAIPFLRTPRSGKRYGILLTLILGGILGFTLGSPAKSSGYIIFIYPFFVLLGVSFIWDWLGTGGFRKKAAWALLGLWTTLLAAENYPKIEFYSADYNAYIRKIQERIPKGSVFLANDNLWVGLSNHGKFFGVNGTAGLSGFFQRIGPAHEETPQAFGDYLKSRKIEYVVLDEEFREYLPAQYERTLFPFLKKGADLIATFEDPFYTSDRYRVRRSPAPLKTEIYRVR